MTAKLTAILLLSILMLISAHLYAQFGGGSGTENDPYLIATPAHLDSVRYYLSSHFRQVANIDLNVAPYNSGDGWESLGVFTADDYQAFTGSYDGNGYEIANLYINRPGAIPFNDFRGLFRWLVGAQVTNVRLTGVNITAANKVGALAGAVSDGSVITGCSAEGVINGEDYLGGLTSQNMWCAISNCKADVDISGSSYVGGLVGLAEDNISNCYATGNVTGDSSVGGLCGEIYTDEVLTVSNCYSTGLVTGITNHGGLCGNMMGATINNCYWDTQTSGQATSAAGEGRTTDEMTYPYAANTYVNWDFTNVWDADITGTENNGYPTLHAFADTSVVVTPLITPPSGFYPDPFITVTMQTSTPGAEIRYTLDGNDPTELSLLYTVPLELNLQNDSVTLKARAYRTDLTPSEIVTADYWTAVANPVFDPPAGFYSQPVVVTIQSATPAALIYYTLDSNEPTEQSALYTEPINIASSLTLKAKAFRAGFEASEVVTANYIIADANDDDAIVPSVTALLPARPNPFQCSTSIRFNLKESGALTLSIFNLKGQLVRILADCHLSKGYHSFDWDGRTDKGRQVPAGIYLCCLKGDNVTLSGKLTLIR